MGKPVLAPASCNACGDRRVVRSAIGETRPCSRCSPAAFNQWALEAVAQDKRVNAKLLATVRSGEG